MLLLRSWTFILDKLIQFNIKSQPVDGEVLDHSETDWEKEKNEQDGNQTNVARLWRDDERMNNSILSNDISTISS